MMKQTNKRGFTLIELLVVIAIIGILASVVLASLNTARDKGKDASAISSFNQARAAAEITYSTDNGSYDNVCPTIASGNPTAPGAASSAVFASSTRNARNAITTGATASNAVPGFVSCGDSSTAYAVSITLLNNQSYCIDSTGFAGQRSTMGVSGQACPSS